MAARSWDDLLWGLANVFSPAEAEAKVVGVDPQARSLIDATRTGAPMPGTRERDPLMSGRYDPQRKTIYRDVLQSAEERPEVVTVDTQKGILPDTDDAAGAYYPNEDAIRIKAYDPNYSGTNRYTDIVPTAVNYQDTLSHELIHFLLKKLAPELAQRPPSPDLLAKFTDLPVFQQMHGAFVQGLLGTPQGQHDFLTYLQGLDYTPVRPGPTGKMQPNLEGFLEVRPLSEMRSAIPTVAADVYGQVLQRILKDPALLKQALQGLQQGTR